MSIILVPFKFTSQTFPYRLGHDRVVYLFIECSSLPISAKFTAGRMLRMLLHGG
eukprot:SAG31_NODE_1578_length_7835_cov_6.998449_6_plen_54_part_00